MTTNYAIVSVDWNPEQTKLWRRSIDKHSPGAKVFLFHEHNRVGCWSCPKLTCFEPTSLYNNVEYIIYLDTDTLVLHDLSDAFLLMEGDVGLSPLSNFAGCQNAGKEKVRRLYDHRGKDKPSRKDRKRLEWLDKEYPDTRKRYVHYSSGMIVVKRRFLEDFYSTWMDTARFMWGRGFMKTNTLFEEYALSLCALDWPVWEIPAFVHDNLLRVPVPIVPWVLHYHNMERIKRFGHEELIVK